MSAQHTPERTGGTARLRPVCPASRDKFTTYASKDRPDAAGRVSCPVCCKVVKLGPGNGVIGTRIVIPHHHMGQIYARALAVIAKATHQEGGAA